MATYTKEGTGPGPEVMGASTLIHDKVVNLQGEDLGKIEELMIDMNSGCVRYGVLSFGGFLGMGDKLFAVPFELLELDTANKRFVFDVEREKLEKAPGFDKSDWPRMAQHEWGREIYAYYGVTPYWEKEEGSVGGIRRSDIEEKEYRI